MACGWSEMVNFMAVTTVVLMRAEGEPRLALSLGRSDSGDMRQSLPKHSATTFLKKTQNKTLRHTGITITLFLPLNILCVDTVDPKCSGHSY